jgi:hypothetical protein
MLSNHPKMLSKLPKMLSKLPKMLSKLPKMLSKLPKMLSIPKITHYSAINVCIFIKRRAILPYIMKNVKVKLISYNVIIVIRFSNIYQVNQNT